MPDGTEKADKRIPVTESTQTRLAEYCGKQKTYDDGINELLDDNIKIKNLMAEIEKLKEEKAALLEGNRNATENH